MKTFFLYCVSYDWNNRDKTYTFIGLVTTAIDPNEMFGETQGGYDFAASPTKLWVHGDVPLADGHEFLVTKKTLI